MLVFCCMIFLTIITCEEMLVMSFVFLLFRYYEGLQRCLGLFSEKGHYSSDEIGQLEDLYKSLAQQYNKSSAVKVA